MTWTPETNLVIWCLMTPEEKDAMNAAKHGWEYLTAYGWIKTNNPPWDYPVVYRAAIEELKGQDDE